MLAKQDVGIAAAGATNAVEHNAQLGVIAAVEMVLAGGAALGRGIAILRKAGDAGRKVARVARAAKSAMDTIPEEGTGSGGGAPDPDDQDGYKRGHGPQQAPKELRGFPDAKPMRGKSSVQGGGKLRERWEDKRHVYEWDSRHRVVEKYSKATGKHLGKFRPETGALHKPANPRKILRD